MVNPQNPERHYSSLKVYLLALNTMISGFLVGYTAGVFNPSMINVAHTLEWGNKHIAYIAVCSALMHAGAFFGGLSSSYLANRFGRLKSIIFADLQGSCWSYNHTTYSPVCVREIPLWVYDWTLELCCFYLYFRDLI
jgi:hypothetical protein